MSLNNRIAVRLSALILSLGCFWALNVGLAVGLLIPCTMPVVQFLSSAWFQAVALPLIGVSATISAMEVMALIRETHDAVMEMLTDLHAKHDLLHTKINADCDTRG